MPKEPCDELEGGEQKGEELLAGGEQTGGDTLAGGEQKGVDELEGGKQRGEDLLEGSAPSRSDRTGTAQHVRRARCRLPAIAR